MPTDVVEIEPSSRGCGEDLGLSEQKRECPLCGQVFTLRGLYGHLRIGHGKRGKQVSELAKLSRGDLLTEIEEICLLLDRVKLSTARYREILALERHRSITKKKAKAFKNALSRQENEAEKELKKYGINLSRSYVNELLRGAAAHDQEGEEESEEPIETEEEKRGDDSE